MPSVCLRAHVCDLVCVCVCVFCLSVWQAFETLHWMSSQIVCATSSFVLGERERGERGMEGGREREIC
jgi:hypothetical protein